MGLGVISLSPQTVHPFLMLLFGGIVLRMPDAAVFQVVGQELLADEIAGIVVGVFIVAAVTELFHQFGGALRRCRGTGRLPVCRTSSRALLMAI